MFVFLILVRSRQYIEGLYTEWEEEGDEDDIEQVKVKIPLLLR